MIYLNNASTSYPKPQKVWDAVSGFIQQPPLNRDRSGIGSAKDDIAILCRNNLKKILGVEDDANRIIFTSGSTESLNLAIRGLDLEGKHVISTNSEHNSVIRPLNYLEKKGHCSVSWVKTGQTGAVSAESIEAEIRDNTALICINHCSNVTGAVQDIEKIAEIAHNNDALILADGSQSSGIMDLKLSEWGIDMFAFTGHKSLYGIRGIGGLYIREGLTLDPLKYGGTGILSAEPLQPERLPQRYEAGTPNMPGIASLNAGVEWILEKGYDEISRNKSKFVKQLIDEFSGREGVEIYSNTSNTCNSVFAFNLTNYHPEEVNYVLNTSFDIHIRSGLHCAPRIIEDIKCGVHGTLRVSPSYFTSQDEIDSLIEALNLILNEGI